MTQSYFEVGLVKIHFYGIFISLGIIFWYYYLKTSLKQFKDKNRLNSIIVVSIFSALVGARLYHVLSWHSYYKSFPAEVFYFWQGGLGVFGAIFGGLLGILFYAKFKKINLLSLLNIISPPLLIVQAIGRLGNFFNHEAFGPPTDLPWKVYIPIAKRPLNFLEKNYFHPTFFYESILCTMAFLIYLFFAKKYKSDIFGFAYYLASYGIIRSFTEFYRIDTWKIYNISVGHLLSLIMISLGVWLWYTLINKEKARKQT